MAHLFSVADIVVGGRRALTRFPEANLAGLSCAALAVAAIYWNESDTLIPWFWAAFISLPLGVCLGLQREVTGARGWAGWWPSLALLAGLIAYAVGTNVRHETHITRFFALALVTHLLAAFWLYRRAGQEAEFWHYNRSLFLRALLTGVYSATVFFGVAGALLAVDTLFGFRFAYNQYGYVFVVSLFAVGTLIMTAGLPARFDEHTTEQSYPRPLLHFVQFILLPLVTVYVLILYAYGIYILLGEFPKGIVSWLVLVFSVAGVFALLLVFPLREAADRPWVRGYARGFYPLLLPLVALLLYAIGVRIADYGLTEARVVLVYLGVWLGGMALYYTLRPRGDIRLLPVSMAVLTTLAAVGPLSMSSLSLRSQNARLEAILTEKGALVNGQYRLTEAEPDSLTREVNNIIDYVNQWHGLRSLGAWAQPVLDTLGHDTAAANPKTDRYTLARSFRAALGMKVKPYRRAYGDEDGRIFVEITPKVRRIDASSGHVFLLDLNTVGERHPEDHPDSSWALTEAGMLTVKGSLRLEVDLAPELRRVLGEIRKRRVAEIADGEQPYVFDTTEQDTTLTVRFTHTGGHGRIELIQLNGRIENKQLQLNTLKGVLYLNPDRGSKPR